MKYLGLILLLIILSITEATALASSEAEYYEQTGTTGQVFYVSRRGNNTTGLSWATAWNELNQIRWDLVLPGATIYIDGGGTRMLYRTTMVIGRSGNSNNLITISTSDMAGHNGQVVFFGGRANNLPYCNQATYRNQADRTMREHGIITNGHDFILIDGMHWRGIRMHGYRDSAIVLDPDSRYITVRNVEIYNNGAAIRTSRGWVPEHPGVRLAGQFVTFRQVIIHDNGQDAFQSLHSQNEIADFRLIRSWLYNGRPHPRLAESSNYCTHTDGIQIYSGGVVTGIAVIQSVFGPGFTQNVMFGQETTDSGQWADVQDVSFRDVVFSRGADNGVVAYRGSTSSNWLLLRVTIDCRGTKSHCLRIENANHTIRDSIIVDGRITLSEGLRNFSGNCTVNTTGSDIGREVSSVFVSVSTRGMFALDDYTVSADLSSVCTGSTITSAAQLLSMP
jgi:hypothetical protein